MKKRKGEDVGDGEILSKKSKVSGFVEGKGNKEPGDLMRAVKVLLQKDQTRLSGLTKLLNALKGSQNKEMIEGIIKEGGEFQEVFQILEGGRHNLSQLEIQKCLEILENILLFTADATQLSSRVGMWIVQQVLQGHMKTLYTCLNPGNPPDVIKAALRLLTAMVTQGASAAREVQRSFDFTLKSLGSLTNKRDTKSAQDVRTCFIYFCVSFLMFGDLPVMKQILELRGFLQSVVKGLQFDSPNVVHAVLSTFQTRVVQNGGITKKTKVQFFNSYVLSQLATLYQYSKDAEEERPQTVRHQVHELLLKICGSFKFGICFSNTTGAFATRSNNPVLLRFLQNLSSVASDVLIQELVIKVLCCCQDVVNPFLSGLTATYEPRPSIQWVASMNLVTKIYMALPQPSHMLMKTSLKMSVDMLPYLMKMVIPAGISRTVLNRGVQHSSSLVKHLTLSLLVVMLKRAQNAVACLASQSNSVATHEHTLLQHLREEILKGLPDVKTVISLRQNLVGSNAKEDSQEDVTSPTILLAQSLKVILGFQTLWPSILSHINFDLKKLLPGQQQINFPPIVEHLTLQILLQAPAGSLKWHQQKGKNSTSFVYSVISLYTSARNENIKDKAKQLLWKLLSETGLVSNGFSEIDIWLTQLEQSSPQRREGGKETLVWFLDEVFTAVSSEPHVYADITVDMQGEIAAVVARMAQSGVESLEWSLTSGTSLPVSLLLVGALKRYTEMVGETSEPVKEAAARNTDCVARYMNCVIFDMIHCSVYPIIVGFAVCRYYENTVIPRHLKALRGVHQALLQYVSYWLPETIQEKFRHFKEQARGNEKHLTKLYNFLGKTIVKTEKEKEMASAELYHHLELLDDMQLRTVICGCVEFCKSQLSGDFSPVVDVVKVKNCKFTGLTSIESIAPLLQVLPFSILLWQVFGEFLHSDVTSPHEIQKDVSLEKDSLSSVLNSWMQDLLIRALEKEPISKTVSHCRHLFLYLNALKTELLSVPNSLGQQRLQSAMLLCFQLLQYLVQRSVVVQKNFNENKSNILEVERAGISSSTISSPTVVLELDSEVICRSVFHHPVLLNCFLWQPEQASSQAICKDLSVQLSYSTCNLLLAVLPSLTLQHKHTLMGPFLKKLSHVGRTEIQSAKEENVGSSSQVLLLLGLFHEYCDHKTREQFISSLSELPSNILVSTDSASGKALPSAFLLTLLTLLEGESLCEDNLPQSSSTLLRNAESNAKEPLTVAHFKYLINISVDVNCPQLDATIMKLLQSSLLYVLYSTTSLFDSCFDNPSEAKIAVAAHLVVHSPSLRSHFELRCLSRSNTLKMKAHANTSPIQYKDYLKEFIPLVTSYLFCVHGLDQYISGENRAQAVISHLLQLYWEPLWRWLVGDREGTFKSSEAQCMKLLVAMIHINKRDDGLEKNFSELLSKASLWDTFQFRICYQLLRRLCHERSADEEATGFKSAFCFACMEYLSMMLERKGDKQDDHDVFEDNLAHLELICKESTPLTVCNDGCVSTWNIFVTNSLRYKFESANVLRALRCVIQTLYAGETSDECVSSTLLPLDTLYEMVLSHSQFLEVILSDEEAGKRDLKEALTELMVAIVEKSPACCQSSHLPVLFAAYTASLSTADQSILYLLNLYEKNHTSFKNYRPTLWGPAAASHHQIAKSLGPSLWQQPSVTEVLEQFDASRMNQSAVSFPQDRRLQPQVQPEFSHEKRQGVYDPCFLLPLFSCLLAPNYQVDCRKFVEQGCLSFTVASLSSRDSHVRQAGYHVISRFMTHLEGTRFKERKQIFHLLKCLKNGITEANVRISSVMVCFIARVAYILLKPEHPFYIMMNSYLLQRPALDLRDLPLFYSMFNSSTMQHTTERSWMLQLLVNGMKDSPDYYLYKRRHAIELALSYHDSPVSDQHSQDLVTQLLMSALKIHPAAYDLAKNYGVIAWIHSLCFKSPERLCTSLNLLHNLWFTLYRGEVEKRVAVTSNEGGEDTHVQKAVRLPPNVAQECVLVCWTLLEQLRSQPLARDTSGFFELLATVTSYLKANQQQSGLSRDRIVSLLQLWCAAFNETCALNQLLSFSINKGSSIDTQPSADCNDSKMKTDSLYSLLSILTTWEPSLSPETDEIVLLVWRFGLSWRYKSSMDDTLGNCCLRGDEGQIPIPFLSLLRWFRKCLVRNRSLQNRLVTESPTAEIKVILQIYQTGLASGKTGLLEHWGHRASQINVRFSVIRELNMICLILFAAVQRTKHDHRLALSQPAICQLMSQEPYAALITKGLQDVLLPLLPNPSSECEDSSFQVQDVILQELVSLFMQELWMERPSPDQFLSFLLSYTDCGCPVVDSLVLALGGTKVIASWTQNQNM